MIVDTPQHPSIHAVKNHTARSQLLGGKYKEHVVPPQGAYFLLCVTLYKAQ